MRYEDVIGNTQATHPQMREVAIPLQKEFQKLISVAFDNIEVE